MSKNVQKYISIGFLVHLVQHRFETTSNLGQKGLPKENLVGSSNHSEQEIFVVSLSKVRNGHIKRITDNDIQSLVLEIISSNVSTTFITCPADPKKTLGIKLPFLVMIIKNLKKYFTFEVQVSSVKIIKGHRDGSEVIDIFRAQLLLIFPRLLGMELQRCYVSIPSICMHACSRFQHTHRPNILFLSIKVLDDKNVRRRFRASNYQSTTRVKPFICTMPMRLDVSCLIMTDIAMDNFNLFL